MSQGTRKALRIVYLIAWCALWVTVTAVFDWAGGAAERAGFLLLRTADRSDKRAARTLATAQQLSDELENEDEPA